MGFYGDTLSSPNDTNLNIVFDKIYQTSKPDGFSRLDVIEE